MKADNTILWHDKVIFWALVFLIFSVPLLMNPYNLANFEPIKLTVLKIIASFILIIWIAKTIETGYLEFKYSALGLPILSLLIFASIATATSINHHISLFGKLYRYEGLLTVIIYVVIYYTALNFIQDNSQINILIGSLFISSTIIGAYGIAQHFGFDFMSWSSYMDVSRSFSTFGNAVFFGSYLSLVLPVTLITLISNQNVYLKGLAGASFALLLSCLVFTYTRAAWIGFCISLVFMSPFILKKLWKNKKVLLTTIALLLAGGIIIALPAPKQISGKPSYTVSQRLEETTQAGRTIASRIYTWGVSLKAIRDKPLLGFGPDTFRYVYLKYRTRDWLKYMSSSSPMDKAHNQLLQLASTTGLLGLLAYLWLIILFLWKETKVCYSKLQVSAKNFWSHSLLVGLVAAVLGYQIQNISGINILSSAFLFWTFLGLAMAAPGSLEKTPQKKVLLNLKLNNLEPSLSLFLKILLYMLLTFLMILTIIFSVRPLVADYYIQQGLGYTKSYMYMQAATEFQKATSMNSDEPRYWILLGTAYQSNFFLTKDSYSFSQAEKAFNQAKKLNPWGEDTYFQLASLYQVAGESLGNESLIDVAIQNYNKLNNIDPYDFATHFSLGLAYSGKKQYDKAILEWKKSIAIDPNVSKAYFNIGRAYEKKGQKEKARKYYQKALKIDPNYTNAKKALERLE